MLPGLSLKQFAWGCAVQSRHAAVLGSLWRLYPRCCVIVRRCVVLPVMLACNRVRECIAAVVVCVVQSGLAWPPPSLNEAPLTRTAAPSSRALRRRRTTWRPLTPLYPSRLGTMRYVLVATAGVCALRASVRAVTGNEEKGCTASRGCGPCCRCVCRVAMRCLLLSVALNMVCSVTHTACAHAVEWVGVALCAFA